MTPNPQAADTGVLAEPMSDAYRDNLLESLANWLRGNGESAWAKDFGKRGLMNTYADDLERIRTALLAGAAGGQTEPVAWKWEVLPGTEQYKRKGNKEGVYLEDPASLGIPMEHPSYRWTKLYDHSPPLPVGAPQGVSEADLPPLPQSFFRVNAAPHAASHGVMLDAYRAEQVRQAQREAYAAGLAARPATTLATIENGPWKSGVEYLPYHPDASHVRPDYRDGWNACYRAALATPSPAQAEPKYDPRMMYLENEKGALDLRIEGLSMRQIKDIFEQEYGALMWSEGCAYPCDKVKVRSIRADLSPTGAAEGAEPTADAERGVEANKALTQLRFFRDLTERQRIDLFSQFKAIPAGAEDEVNSHTIEHTLFNFVWASPQRDRFSEAIDAARAAQKGQR